MSNNFESPIWQDKARLYIRQWFENNGLLMGTLSTERLEMVYKNHCSENAYISRFNKFNYFIKLISEARGENSQQYVGAVIGCDWGLKDMYAAQNTTIHQLILIDQTQRYIGVTQKIIEEWLGLSKQIKVYNHPIERLKNDYNNKMDFVYVTTSFVLENYIEHFRELIGIFSLVRVSGIIVIDIRNLPGLMSLKTIQQLLIFVGFEIIAIRPNISIVAKKVADIIIGKNVIEQHCQELVRIHNKTTIFDSIASSFEEHVKLLDSEINNKVAKLSTLPITLDLFVTSRCNLRCVFCDYPDKLRHSVAPENLINQVINNIHKFSSITITGGEPTLAESTFRFLRNSAEKKLYNIDLRTNFSCALSNDMLCDILYGSYEVRCSIDAATKKTYDLIRGHGNWEQLINNINRLIAKKIQLQRDLPKVIITFVITNLNYLEISNFIKLAITLGVNGVAFKWLQDIDTPRMTDEVKVCVQNVAAIFEQLVEACKISNDNGKLELDLDAVLGYLANNYPSLFELCKQKLNCIIINNESYQTGCGLTNYSYHNTKLFCSAPFVNLILGNFNHVGFCCYALKEYYVKTPYTEGLNSIWNNEKFMRAREYFYKGMYNMVCRSDCGFYQRHLKKFVYK